MLARKHDTDMTSQCIVIIPLWKFAVENYYSWAYGN